MCYMGPSTFQGAGTDRLLKMFGEKHTTKKVFLDVSKMKLSLSLLFVTQIKNEGVPLLI